MLILDTEIYSDYFLLSFKQLQTGKIRHFELFDGQQFDFKTVNAFMSSHTTISFNGLNFDLPIIAAVLAGYGNRKLKVLCDELIRSNLPAYRICKERNLNVPKRWDHIDLIEVAPGQASLKIYGGRMGVRRLQDLPIPPDASILPEQRGIIREYCENDLATTEALYNVLRGQIALRETMSKEYGFDLRSKSDAQIAETIITHELSKLTGKTYTHPQIADGQVFRYLDPKIVKFKSHELTAILNRLVAEHFTLGSNGAIRLPEWLKNTKISVGGAEYQMGIGGLHSCESQQHVAIDDMHLLFDLDVASFYPNIILQQGLAPKSLGAQFLSVYRTIVKRRLSAKRANDKVTADVLKIAVNGSFGKLGSKWSALYAPDLLIQTTITGQLSLLMLIERIVETGARVISANTDGVVVYCPHNLENAVENAAWEWMLDTSYELERTNYKSISSRDVNNYVAVKQDGTTKGKGVFATPGLSKNPDCQIVYEAVAQYLAKGIPLEQTIRECRDILKFVKIRHVKGGAVWNGEHLGKAVRFYYSTSTPHSVGIHYLLNNNLVPMSSGGIPCMNLPDEFPQDIDYPIYLKMAEKLLCEVGI